MSTGMNKTTLLFIRKSLEHCARCPGFYGAVLSSPDGLVLASSGQLGGDEGAACASSFLVNSTSTLRDLPAGPARELLVWSEDKLLNVVQLHKDCILLIASTDMNSQDSLRRVSRDTAQMLEPALKILD